VNEDVASIYNFLRFGVAEDVSALDFCYALDNIE
jgi:hypothetical protein